MSLSERIRPNSEAAPWVIEEVKKLESYLEVMKINWKHQMDRAARAEDKIAAMEPELEAMTSLAKSIPSLGSAHERMEKAEKKLRAIYTVWGSTDADRLQELKDCVYDKFAELDAELAAERAKNARLFAAGEAMLSAILRSAPARADDAVCKATDEWDDAVGPQ